MRDINTESSVIGDIIQNPHLFLEAAEILNPDDFLSPRCQKIYQAMMDLALEGPDIDLVSLAENLKGKVKTSELVDIQDQAIGTSNFSNRCYIVKEQWLGRQLKDKSHQIIKRVDNYSDTLETLGWLDQEIQELYSQVTSNSVEKNSTVFSEILSKYEKVKKGGLLGVSTGLTDLDRITYGLQDGLFYAVGARPACGKSVLLTNIGVHVAKKGIPVVMFSFEMSPEQIMSRVVCSELNISSTRLKSGKLTPEEEKSLKDSRRLFEALPFYISRNTGSTPVELMAKVKKLKRDKGIALVLVDYLQLMRMPTAGNREQEIAAIARGMKDLAGDVGVPVVAATQLNRAVELRDNKRPMLADLRESGELEQATDVVVLLHRPEIYGISEFDDGLSTLGTAEIRVVKQRDGVPEDFYAQFNGAHLRFQNYTRREFDI